MKKEGAMNYNDFRRKVLLSGWTLEQLRRDVPPTRSLRNLIDEVGERYEAFVLRWERESK